MEVGFFLKKVEIFTWLSSDAWLFPPFDLLLFPPLALAFPEFSSDMQRRSTREKRQTLDILLCLQVASFMPCNERGNRPLKGNELGDAHAQLMRCPGTPRLQED
jgi:hypothetical protein